MGRIKDAQFNSLLSNHEDITFKTFDSDGLFLGNEDINLFKGIKQHLRPIKVDLVKEYERPNKIVEHSVKLSKNYFKNNNAHFMYGDTNFVIQTPSSGKTASVISDTDEEVKALSGTKYFKTNDLTLDSGATASITISRQYTTIAQKKPLAVGFNYHIVTADDSDKFQLAIKVGLQETYGSGDYLKEYDFQNNEWIDYNGSTADMSVKTIDTSTLNSWGKFTATLVAYETANTDDDVHVDVTIVKIKNIPTGTTNADFVALYVDNFFIAETAEFADQKITSRRKQVDNNGTFTNKYETNNHFLSNEAKNTDYFIGQFDGEFKRSRDSANKSLEQIITQEKINDYRHYLTRYEGTLRDNVGQFIGFHHKLFMNFGEDYQDNASCVLDSMKYDVKASEYQVNMHLPNQDDDTDSTYVALFE